MEKLEPLKTFGWMLDDDTFANQIYDFLEVHSCRGSDALIMVEHALEMKAQKINQMSLNSLRK